MPANAIITSKDFEQVDIRVGQITSAELIEGGTYSTHYLVIDFGPELGQKKSCARLINYQPDELIGRQVLAVVNFPPRQIGKHVSEVLTLGVPDENGDCILIQPDQNAPLGGRLY